MFAAASDATGSAPRSMLSNAPAEADANSPFASSRERASACVIGSCRTGASVRQASASVAGASPSIMAMPRSTRRTGTPQPCRISVALLDHGDTVPRRGITHSEASCGKPMFASRISQSFALSIAMHGSASTK